MHVLQLVTNDEAPFFRQQVASLDRLGITCDVRSPAGGHSSTESRSIGAYARIALETLRDSPQRYDLIHANYGLTAPAALIQHRLPTVVSLWGSDLLGRYGTVCRFCARHADEVIVMTPQMADALDTPSHVIPHGIDMDQFRPISTEAAREEVGWETDRKHVLFPYSPDREIKDFPKAASVVAAVRKHFDEPVTLQTLSDVDHSRMVYYYNASDAVLLTSKREGSPNVIKEALACNTPVVATDVGDVDLRLSGVSPSAVCTSKQELVDALILVLESDEQPEGRKHVQGVSETVMAHRIKRVYERALGRERTPETTAVTSSQLG